ncbi:fungal-specific transcription factor domain-containing protein [Coniochaeta sp. 2T2.1]|nr:fungal-specific transcription factor domain-containing protein [Coniochaeta sp. 2T2.1]
MSEPSSVRETSSPPPRDGESREGDSPDGNPHPRKRQRVRLSCLECRRRKLSCDRELPCSRCLQSGTPEKCEYEARPGGFTPNRPGISQSLLASIDGRLSLPGGPGDSLLFTTRKDALREHDRIRKLELEVAQLKNLLTKQASLDSSSTVVGHSPPSPKNHDGLLGQGDASVPSSQQPQDIYAEFKQDVFSDKEELRFYRGREFKTRFYGPTSGSIALKELAGLSPVMKFMRETGDEWLRPLLSASGTIKKDRELDRQKREEQFLQPDKDLEALLPSKEEADSCVQIYLEQFEQLHRIVHIPSFRRDYAKFWDPKETRYTAFTVLVLAICSVTSCISTHAAVKFEKLVSTAHTRALRWIKACEEWEEKQSQKHRRLIHYQISCLLYLSKRINTVKKKRFWKGAGGLILDAVSVGLHREPHSKVSPFNQEMRRRIWATLQSFDMQASFDHGLPSLLASLPINVKAPRNIDDEDFDEDTEELPESKPTTEYTYASYQHISRQSLPLRLELCKVLTGPGEPIDYDDVIRYTSEISREIDSLPSWDAEELKTGEAVKKPLLAYTLLHIQLRAYIIPLHQSYLRLRKTNPKYQYSEMIYYSSVRDMILLNDALMKQGLRTLNFLREDSLTLAINLCSVTMLQPRGSTNMIMISSQDTMSLIDKCLQMREDRVLRCGNNEPWGYSILCAARELLAVHLGEKTPEAAKAAAAERFVNMHLKILALQDPPASTQQSHQSDKQALLSQLPPPPPSQSAQSAAAANPLAALAAGPEVSGFRSKSATPFPASQSSATQVNNGPIEVPGTPWWVPNPSDPTAITPQMQPLNPDFRPDITFEHFGLDLNSLWGGDLGDLGDWDGELVI